MPYLARKVYADNQRICMHMYEYVCKGYAEYVQDINTPTRLWYLPHYPGFEAFKPDKFAWLIRI